VPDPNSRVVAAACYCFRDFSPFVAYQSLPALGIRHVDVPVAAGGGYFTPELMEEKDVQRLSERLASLGVTPVIVGAYCDFLNPRHVEAMRVRLDFARKLGVGVVVTDAARKIEVDRDEWRKLVNRLRYVGDFAADSGVRIAVETHVGLTHSGAIALRLLQEVDHPAVGINYDTGNIFFYNDDVDPAEEIKLVADRVFGVHLKDTRGGKGDWSGFCDLGQGRVNLPAIVAVLDAVGFRGPYCVELEAQAGEDLNREGCLAKVDRSAAYLRKIGLLPAR